MRQLDRFLNGSRQMAFGMLDQMIFFLEKKIYSELPCVTSVYAFLCAELGNPEKTLTDSVVQIP